MKRPNLELKFAELRDLRSVPEERAVPALRRLLADPSHHVIARAAVLTGDRHLTDLVPDLLASYARMLVNPVESDPQCVAKFPILVALKELGYANADFFLAGTRYTQFEPDVPKPTDKAPPVRGLCALALIGCDMDDFEALERLTDMLLDPAPVVRGDAARAIGGMGMHEGILPLRLKIKTGDREPRVLGDCFTALLMLEPTEYLDFVAGFLHGTLWIEAAIALAGSPELRAVTLLTGFWGSQDSTETRTSLVGLLATSPVEAAAEFLVKLLETAEQVLAERAIEGLAKGRFRARVEGRVRAAVEGRPGLREAFEAEFC